MKSINLYVLTRVKDFEDIALYEKALSLRDEEIKCRKEEIEIINLIVNQLLMYRVLLGKMDGFFIRSQYLR